MKVVFKTILEDFNSDLWGHHIKVKKKYAEPFITGTERRVMCSINGGKPFHAGLIPNGEWGYFININKSVRDKYRLALGDEIEVELTENNSRYGIEVSEEFLAAIEMDPVASDLFHALTPGKQRSLIYMATKPKKAESRLNKALVILEYLKINNGNLDYKTLMQAFKEQA